MTKEDVVGWLEFLSEQEHIKADGIVPCDTEIALGMAIEALKQPERKQGKWICIGGTADKYGVKTTMFRCSECNERTDRVDTKRSINFCPMCGAEMEEIKQ